MAVTDLPHTRFLISAILDRSIICFIRPPNMPKRTPPTTKSLNTTIPCIGPTKDQIKGRKVGRTNVNLVKWISIYSRYID